MGSKKRSSPCGKGQYRVVTKVDDWNRWDETVMMLCEECNENYELKTYTKSDGEEHWYWKKKDS